MLECILCFTFYLQILIYIINSVNLIIFRSCLQIYLLNCINFCGGNPVCGANTPRLGEIHETFDSMINQNKPVIPNKS